MRKILTIWLFLSLCPFLMAQNLNVTKNSYEQVAITFTTDSISVDNVSVPEGNFSIVSIQGYDISNNPGAPQLPLLAKFLQIPVCDSVVVTIVNAEYKEYDASDLGIAHPLYPNQPSVSKSELNPPFAYDQTVYSTDAFYSLPLVKVEKSGVRRDIALANVYVSPIQYNPVTKRVRIYTQIETEFSFVNTDMTATQRLDKYASPMFSIDNDLVLNLMDNDAKNEFSGVPIKYLIIANSMFSSNANLNAFVEWKRRLGYNVELAFTSDANVGNTTTSIKNFIQNKYNNATTADPAPTFLLLIGDVAQLPAFTGQSNSGHVTDLYYATLAGNDNIPDCYYGRLSATNNDHLTNQIAKILMYEQYTMPDPSYLGNAVLIAGTDGNGYSPTHADGQINYVYNYYVNPNSTTHNFTTVYKHNYNCSSQAATIRSEINAGVSLANYTAHGSSSGWADPSFTTSHVPSMTNANKYGLLIGNCCVSGKFDESECFGEALLRAANKGAMGYIGASNNSYWNEDVYWAVGVRSSINANMSYDAYKLGAYDKLFHTHNEAYSNWVSTIGGILQGGNLAVQSSSSSRKLYYWEIYHCFGDPSVRVYLGIPNAMTVMANADIPVSSSSYSVQAVPYAYVALKKNTTQYIASGFANSSGTVTLTLPSSLEIGTYELVVLAQNYIPYFQTIEVIDDGACASPSNLTVSNVTPFSATLSWTGNADRYNIQRKTNSTDWATLATNVTATTYSLTSLQDNTDYQVRVQAVCGTQTSYWKTVDFTTPVACPVPTDLVCMAFTPTTATLNWTENGSANQWTLQYGTNSNFNTGTYTQVTVSGDPAKLLTGLTAETTYYARVRANCGGIYGTSQWSAVSTFMPSAVQTVEIGDGSTTSSTYLPSYNYYKYCISQQIYTPEEIGSAGSIRSISFKNTGEEKSRTYAVYLQHTDKPLFSDNADWVAVNSNNLVFNGDVTLTSGEWTKISFTHPFIFDGESNLLVTVVDNTGSYTNSPHMSCLVFNAPSKAIHAYRDTPGEYDITAPGVSGTVTDVKNQIRIDILASEGPSCPKPNGLVASDITVHSATLNWNENGTANKWVLQYGTNNSFTAGTYTEVTVSGSPSKSLSGLSTETEYFARVKAVCSGADESNWSGTCIFTPSSKTIIGSGSSTNTYLPTHNYYKYSLTQQIYTSEELGVAGDIVSIDFHKNNNVECKRKLDIYMVNTTKNSFTSSTDWITVTDADKVFSDTVIFNHNAWTTITLDTPFSYDGTHNIAIIVDDNTGSYKSSTPFLAFSASSQAIRIYSDNTNYDANAPSSYSGTVEASKNQIRLMKIVPEPCPEPSEFSATACGSYTWSGVTYSSSGNYTRTFTTAAGCDSVVTLHLTIHNPVHTATTVVECGSYTWNGKKYTVSGDYTYPHADIHGCTQVDTLHLTINYATTGDTTAVACESFTWHGFTYTKSGDYTYHTTNVAGCDSTVTLHLTIHNPVHTAVTVVECGSYTWNGTKYTTSGDYTYPHADIHGCTQVDTLHLTINYATTGDTTAVACESFAWHGFTYTESGDYTYHTTNVAGCDSTVTLHLTIHNPVHTAVTVVECGFYTWNGTKYTTSGDYTYPHADVHGCTQVDTLHLTINYATTGDTTAVACESFAWHGFTYTESGDYTYHTSNVAGCDSTVTLHLTIHNPVHTAVTVVECGSYTWNGTKYTTSGDYTYPHADVHGCTQVDTLHLTINYATTGDTTAVACESFTWHGFSYTESGDYTYHTTNVVGCDSTVTLHLTIYNPMHTAVTVVECGSYTWNGTKYTTSGDYTYVHADVHGCTQVDTLHLTINYATMGETAAVACESFTWHGFTYTKSGDYTYHTTNVAGCDSTVTLHLTINKPTHLSITESACGSFVWHGINYTQSGVYLYIHSDEHGCTQVDTLFLTINNATTGETTAVACESFTWHGFTYTESGDYTYQTTNVAGCDSTVTLHLTINNPVHTATTVTAIDSYIWDEGDGKIHTVSGNYYFSHEDAHGCTQVDTLHLTVHYSSSNDFAVTACESYEWDGVVYTTSGDYTRQYQDIYGADSVVTLHLLINYGTHHTQTETVCESYSWHDSIYTTSGTYLHEYTNIYGCASVDTLHLTVNYGTHNVETEIACERFEWHGVIFKASGTYTYSYHNTYGCASVDTLHLTINNPVHTAVSETVCNIFVWNDSTYTESGDYTYSHLDSNGCTQVDTLHLTVNYSNTGVDVQTACDSFTWIDEQTYTESTNTPTYTLTNAAGCDSVVTLHLTVNYSNTGDTTAVACDSFDWYEHEGITSSGIFTHTFTNANGCDSVVTLHLTVNYSNTGDTTAVACDSFDWYEHMGITSSGIFTHTFTNASGCDSVVTLHLTVNHSNTGDTTAVACDSFDWYEHAGITSNGIFTHTFTNASGCDSVVTLHLTVNYSNTGIDVQTACDSFTWIDEHTYTESTNTPTYTLTNTAGCDSVVTLHLTVNHSNTGDTTAVACNSFDWYEHMGITSSGIFTHTFTNAAGCDSVVTLHLTVNHSNTGDTSAVACDSFDWYEHVGITSSGILTHTFTNASGCDSVVTLHLTVNHSNTGDTTAVACDSFDWYEHEGITSSGIFSHTFTNASGCDSVVTLHLTVNYSNTGDTTAVACDSFDWYEHVGITSSGIFSHTFTNASGCDSVVTLHLTVNHSNTGDTTAVECDSFDWYEHVGITSSGIFTHTFTNAAGCDSVVTLHLTVNHFNTGVDVQTACYSYTWIDGQTYTESTNTPTYTLTNAAGCDSVVTLNLTINHAVSTEFTIETSDSCYDWNGFFYCETGDYTQTLTSENGCDSVVTLHLTTSVGINDHEVSLVYLAPNPTSSICRIIGLDKEPQRVELYDMHGALIQRSKETELDVTTLVSGIYIVKVFTGDGVINLKLIRR
jgi:hypothetical protein